MRFTFFLFLFISTISLNAQIDDIVFRRVSPISGFSFQAIRTIQQDMFGYIWMGTHNDGIIRYNAKGIKRFMHDPNHENGLPSDRITSIAIDKKNNIWVQSNNKLCLFNHDLQQFELIRYSYENGEEAVEQINSIALDGEGNLWVADNKSVGYLNQELKNLIRISKGLNHSPSHLFNDEMNRLWLGTTDGTVYLILPQEELAIKKIDGPGSRVRSIFATQNEVWVGYENHGARLYDFDGKLKTHLIYSAEPEYDIESASIRKIRRDTKGRIWIGSYMGLFLYDGTNLIRFNSDESNDLPHKSVFEIFEDKQGGIWIGTWAGGVVYTHPTDNKFKSFRHSTEPHSLSDNMVSSFVQGPDGKIYVGTEGNGLNKFNVKTEKFQQIKVSETIKNLNIKSILFDQQGGMWVGSGFNGLFFKPKGKSKFTHFSQGTEDGKHISGPAGHILYESDSGIYIGTNLDGVDFYNFNTQQIEFKVKLFPPNFYDGRNIRGLTIDLSNNLWIAAVNGMHQYHIPTRRINPSGQNSVCPHNNSHQYYFVSRLNDGNIWMGTRHHGIEIYNPGTKETMQVTANGLLEGKDVYGIINGQDGNVWITSNAGLILYNTNDKSSRRFIYSDGIQGDLFNPRAIFRDKDGNLYFGGTNGFTLLQPNRIKMNKTAPNVFINSIEVKDKEIIPRQTKINKFNKILLEPYENTIKFDFSANNYLLPEKNRYKYKLVNYMDEWIEADHSGVVTLVNVPPGEYVFAVKACNNDGKWNDTPAELPMVIKQYWYKSRIALALYLFLFASILLILLRFFHERTKLKKAIAIEKIERKHEDMLHEMKLKFFTNISHEFRTPLTLLNWPIKQILNSNNLTAEQRNQLGTIKKNTNRMLQLINQIMDLRKVEKGQLKLNLSKIELVDFVNDRILHFSEESNARNIQFEYNHEKEACIIEADAEKLDKIIFNLLSNAFKFTPENGKINVNICEINAQNRPNFSNQLSFGKLESEDFFEIQVTDDGDGIPSEDLANIFNRFERANPKKTKSPGTGIGLNLCKDYTLLHHGVIIVQSTPGTGTRFSIRIPIKQSAQKILYESHEEVKNINSWESQVKPNHLSAANVQEENILIVEDNEDLRKFMMVFVQKFYNVQIAKNGKQGLKILETHQIHLIISDVMMPVMDGFEFCQIVKSQIETSHIPIILLTALSSTENMSTGLEKGADAYISKPFEEDVLLSQIKNLLQQRKRIQESFIQKFISRQPIDIGSLDNYFLIKVNATIEKNIENEDFSVDRLASEVDLSRSQLHRKLKQISNHSASEYITMVKIKKATTLLTSKNYNIDEVAFKSGFNSHSYFNKCFKKIHQMSPKEYLKQL